MSETPCNPADSRFWELFFDVYEALPRQGPGNRASAEKALRFCTGLPALPAVLDLGCGVGEQTLYLAALTKGNIIAIDNHAPFIKRLKNKIAEKKISERVQARVGDMAAPGISPGSIDLIWSEGALYSIGIANALSVCEKMMRPGGYLVFTDAVWRRENPPPEVKQSFDLDYPGMGRAADVLEIIDKAGLEVISHFTLPDEAWWDDFYTPMQHRITELRGKYANDAEAVSVIDQIAREPELHRLYSDYYAYEFFIVRRPCP